MGRMSRTKGRAYEQHIARVFRAAWPDAVVRRASQADRAHQSDVYITGGPDILGRLWLECQDARNPNPNAKLQQAEWDIGQLQRQLEDRRNTRMPVVVWHRTGARTTYVTLPLWALDTIRGVDFSGLFCVRPVTMDLDAFIEVLKDAASKEGK